MIKKLITVVFLGQALVANAGKLERDYLSKSVNPAIQKAIADVKSACGCTMKIGFDEKEIASKPMDQLSPLLNMAENISEGAKEHCTDKASGAAVCKMKEVKLRFGAETTAKVEGSVGVMTTDGQSNAVFSMLADELDK